MKIIINNHEAYKFLLIVNICICYCSLSGSNLTLKTQCYGALGGTVDIQLVNSTSEIPRYYLLKDSLKILDVRGNKAIYNTIAHKSLILPSNGTFRISDLSRTDSGNYSLITFDSEGRSSGEQILQLLIQGNSFSSQ
uniref:Immunoglobulin V-set domain-containing protein n=1 Tax=Pundamilia nyererei TaxID=303518 RepID=A0A3B4ERS4_9CICH